MFERFKIEKIDGKWFFTYQPRGDFSRCKLMEYLAWFKTDEEMQKGGQKICDVLNEHLPDGLSSREA